ncbi:HepT-like ribonuclease domain-containing protein [Niabella sp.]|uniref:HepT-like ribonuclease domain-containing protein n=1 Tax=Niabella sp. TaxID=1962976 RepID=UPI002632FA96|nr:HepT-like ribonuclease domain-containing protein [Niabella sp.]
MPPEILKYLNDIAFSIERIRYHIKSVQTVKQFSDNYTIYDAVERRFAIIGEALWKADKMDATLAITEKKRIIGLRHILTHDYDLVSPEILWKIIEKNLPVLKQEVLAILIDEGESNVLPGNIE